MDELLTSLTLFDYIAFIILFYCIVKGVVNGFIKEVLGTMSLLLGLVVSKIISKPLSLAIYDYFTLREKLEYKISLSVGEVYKNSTGQGVDQLKSGLQEVLKTFSFLGRYIEESVSNDWGIYTVLKDSGSNLIDELTQRILFYIEPIIQYILGLIVFIILYFILRGLFKLISSLLVEVVQALPIVGTLNSLLGAGFGVIKGVGLIIITFTILFLALNIFKGVPYMTIDDLLDSRVFNLVSEFKQILKN